MIGAQRPCPVCKVLITHLHAAEARVFGPGTTILCNTCGALLVIGEDGFDEAPDELLAGLSDRQKKIIERARDEIRMRKN